MISAVILNYILASVAMEDFFYFLYDYWVYLKQMCKCMHPITFMLYVLCVCTHRRIQLNLVTLIFNWKFFKHMYSVLCQFIQSFYQLHYLCRVYLHLQNIKVVILYLYNNDNTKGHTLEYYILYCSVFSIYNIFIR